MSESTHVKMPHCWKSHALAHILFRFIYCRFIPHDCDEVILPSPSVLVIEKYEQDTEDIRVTGEVFYEDDTWQVKFKECKDYLGGVCPYRLSMRMREQYSTSPSTILHSSTRHSQSTLPRHYFRQGQSTSSRWSYIYE